MQKELTRTCVTCGKDFKYFYKGSGRPRRYCDDCQNIPRLDKERSCPLCGETLTGYQSRCAQCASAPDAARCVTCNKPLQYTKDRFCSVECMGPRPICRLDGCEKPVHRPESLRQWPKYCSERHRAEVFRRNNPGRAVKQDAMLRYWNYWNTNIRRNPNQLQMTDLPQGQGKNPGPCFTESANTGLTNEDLHDNVIKHIMRWTHVINALQDPTWRPEVKRPSQNVKGYMFTTYMYNNQHHRIMPWLWDVMDTDMRYLVRSVWADFRTEKANTIDDITREDITQQLDSYYNRGILPPDTTAKDYEKYLEGISKVLHPRLPFQGIRSFANQQELRNGNKTELKYIEIIDNFFEDCAGQLNAAPPRPRPAQARARRTANKSKRH